MIILKNRDKDMNARYKRLTEDEFYEKFKPIDNHIEPDN